VKKRKFIPVAVALVAIIALSGVAYAYWSSTGGGTGGAGVGSDAGLTVAQTNTITGLVPGGSANIDITVTNGASFHQSFSTVTISFHTGNPPASCLATWFTLTPPAPGLTILAAGGHVDLVGSIAMSDSPTDNQNSCKNANLVLDLSVS
jgi:hypothetical protein